MYKKICPNCGEEGKDINECNICGEQVTKREHKKLPNMALRRKNRIRYNCEKNVSMDFKEIDYKKVMALMDYHKLLLREDPSSQGVERLEKVRDEIEDELNIK